MSQTLVVVCGLRAEARIVGGDTGVISGKGVTLIVGGGDQDRLEGDLHRAAPDARAILSFGIAGGLDLGLRPGDVRIAEAVVQPSGELTAADPRWAAAIARRLGLPPVPLATMAGVDTLLSDIAGKADLHRRSGAATVDMESHIVARVAAAHRLPFAAVRVVTDAADRQLPHAAAVGMKADGSVDLAAILLSLARNPGQLPGLIRTGLDARVAFGALLRSRQSLGPDFAFLDLG